MKTHAHYSLSEIDSTCRKAARGVAYSWGLAEETGKIARGLASFGLPGPQIVLDILEYADGAGGLHTPVRNGEIWRAEKTPLCPIVVGTIISDRAQQLEEGVSYEFEALLRPIAILPPLYRSCEARSLSLCLSWDNHQLKINQDGISGDIDAALIDEIVSARCTQTKAFSAAIRPQPQSCAVDAECWDRLNAFARRTYVPATEFSRLSGAGAGLNDND